MRQSETVSQHKRYYRIISLPKGGNEEKRKADKDDSFCIEFTWIHFLSTFLTIAFAEIKRKNSTYLCIYLHIYYSNISFTKSKEFSQIIIYEDKKTRFCQKDKSTFFCGAPRRIRTFDLPVRSRALYPLSYGRILERVMGIEPTRPAWKAGILPLNYTRISLTAFI